MPSQPHLPPRPPAPHLVQHQQLLLRRVRHRHAQRRRLAHQLLVPLQDRGRLGAKVKAQDVVGQRRHRQRRLRRRGRRLGLVGVAGGGDGGARGALRRQVAGMHAAE